MIKEVSGAEQPTQMSIITHKADDLEVLLSKTCSVPGLVQIGTEGGTDLFPELYSQSSFILLSSPLNIYSVFLIFQTHIRGK